MEEKCENCKYYSRMMEGEGDCRRNAPIDDGTLRITGPTAKWPGVYANMYCGEFDSLIKEKL